MTEQNDQNPDTWPAAAQAAKISGYSRRHLDRLAEAGDIECAIASDGRKRYAPDDLAALSRPAAGDDVLKRALEMLDAANKHLEKLMGSIEKPLAALLESMGTETAGMRARIVELEAVHLATVAHLEDLSSDKAMRSIAQSEHEGRERRKEASLNLLKTQIMPRIGAAMGNAKVEKLLASLTPEQVQVLTSAETGFLAQDQREILASLVKIESTESDDDNDNQAN